jgi:hypothetical protein
MYVVLVVSFVVHYRHFISRRGNFVTTRITRFNTVNGSLEHETSTGINIVYYIILYLENLKENMYGWVTITLILIITI